MDWTKLSLNTLTTQTPKIYNENFTAFENYLDTFYDDDLGIVIVPVNTTGRIKGGTGEFVNVIADNLTVKNQYTNRYENTTTADYDYYIMYTGSVAEPRDPCTYNIDTSIWNVPYEPTGFKVVDVNKPYYKISNENPINLSNDNLSQVVGIYFSEAINGNDFEILLDPCTLVSYTVDASSAGEAYMEFIATGYDASWGSSWSQFKYGVDSSTSSGGGTGDVTQVYVDGSLAERDASIDVLFTSIERIDASLNDVVDAETLFTTFDYVDGSLAAIDASMNELKPFPLGSNYQIPYMDASGINLIYNEGLKYSNSNLLDVSGNINISNQITSTTSDFKINTNSEDIINFKSSSILVYKNLIGFGAQSLGTSGNPFVSSSLEKFLELKRQSSIDSPALIENGRLWMNSVDNKIYFTNTTSTYDLTDTGASTHPSFDYVDGSLAERDASIDRIDTSLNDVIEADTLFTSFDYVDGSLAALKNTSFNTITAYYEVVNTDNGKILELDGSFGINLPDTVDTGFQCTFVNTGTGTITLGAFYGLLTTDSARRMTDQYAGVSAVHKGAGIWYAWGNLK